jgi:glucosamine-6-phosphate deaminase
VVDALSQVKHKEWTNDCWLWLYRGAWQEFEVHEIEMAIPLSPAELLKKRQAIFIHQSQKDKPPFPGEDNREFWQRTEDRNRNTAMLYRALGFAEYEAMEAFKRWIY